MAAAVAAGGLLALIVVAAAAVLYLMHRGRLGDTGVDNQYQYGVDDDDADDDIDDEGNNLNNNTPKGDGSDTSGGRDTSRAV